MATYYTWLQIYNQIVASELDLEDEDFVDKDELRIFANQAIEEAEAEIHTIHEDYFLNKTTLDFVTTEDEILLPDDIYAMKIRSLWYTNGSLFYEIKRIRDWKKFVEYRFARQISDDSQLYVYFITNPTAGAPVIKLTPASRESGTFGEIWYLRAAKRLTFDDDICDIPEFIQFVYDHVRTKVYEKEQHPALPKALADKEATRRRMVETLTAMVPDADNEIEPDFTSYEEMS